MQWINTHSLVPLCLGQGKTSWPKCCPLTMEALPDKRQHFDPKYSVILIRKRGLGAVTVLSVPWVFPCSPPVGWQPSGTCTSLSIPGFKSSLGISGFSAVLPKHLSVWCGIPWPPAQASVLPSSDQVHRRQAVIQGLSFSPEPQIKVSQQYLAPRARQGRALQSPDSWGTPSASSAWPGAV